MTFSHLDAQGQANMVDVGDKAISRRTARARGYVQMRSSTLNQLTSGQFAKGDAFAVARIAGIQAAKKTADLVPLCHPLQLSKIAVDLTPDLTHQRVQIDSYCALDGKTGVEMEAITAVSIAAVTLYDMCKAVDPEMMISAIHVYEKTGGKTGHWQHSNPPFPAINEDNDV